MSDLRDIHSSSEQSTNIVRRRISIRRRLRRVVWQCVRDDAGSACVGVTSCSQVKSWAFASAAARDTLVFCKAAYGSSPSSTFLAPARSFQSAPSAASVDKLPALAWARRMPQRLGRVLRLTRPGRGIFSFSHRAPPCGPEVSPGISRPRRSNAGQMARPSLVGACCASRSSLRSVGGPATRSGIFPALA